LSAPAVFARFPRIITAPDSSAELSGHSTLSIALLLPFDLSSCDRIFEFNVTCQRPKRLSSDLDSCLAAADEVGEQLFAPAFAAIRTANDGSVAGGVRRVLARRVRCAAL